MQTVQHSVGEVQVFKSYTVKLDIYQHKYQHLALKLDTFQIQELLLVHRISEKLYMPHDFL